MRRSIAFLFIAVLLNSSLVLGVELINAGFEISSLQDGVVDANVPSGWDSYKPTSVYWTMNPAVAYEIQPSEGENCCFMSPAGPTANIYQVTTCTVDPNTLYVLEFDVSCLSVYFGTNLSDHAFYMIDWYADQDNVYSSGIEFLSKPSWTTVRKEFYSGDYPSTVGSAMKFSFSGKKFAIDNIQLSVSPARTLNLGVDPADKCIEMALPMFGKTDYLDGEVVEVKANDYIDLLDGFYRFSHWDGPVADSTSRVTTVTMDDDKSVTAVYVLDRRECVQRTGGSAVVNGSFERPVIADGEYLALTDIPGWTIDAADKMYCLYNDIGLVTASDSHNYLGMQLVGAGSGQISQKLPGTIEPDTVYEFSFDVAGYTDGAYYIFSVYASPISPGNLLATETATLTSYGSWTNVTLTWDSSSAPEFVGHSFEIVVGGKKIFLDNFRVSPEIVWGADVVLDISTDPQASNDVYLANSQFELPVMADGDYEVDDLRGWVYDVESTSAHWIYRPASTYSLPSSLGENFLFLAPAGPNAQVSQITEAVIEPDSIYRLQFDVASPSSYDGTPYYYVKVYAAKNGVQNRTSSYLLYDGPLTNILTRDAWNQVTVEIDTTNSPHAGINQFDIILGGKAAFDNVSLRRITENDRDSLWPSVGQYVYDYNDEVYLYNSGRVAKCPDVYLFDYWQSGDKLEGVDGASVVMNSDKHVRAKFRLDTDYVSECGDVCNPSRKTDLNWDCITDFEDIAIFTKYWLDAIE